MLKIKDIQKVFTLTFEQVTEVESKPLRSLIQFILLSMPDHSRLWELTVERLSELDLNEPSSLSKDHTVGAIQLSDT